MKNTLKNLFPTTERRVLNHSAPSVIARNQRQIQSHLEQYQGASRPLLDQRIAELNAEWDIDRALETGAALHVGLGLALGTLANRRWYAWSGVAAAFLLQHALMGWCPPVAVLRRLGIRTAAEIAQEKTALRILRGDFHPTDNPIEALWQTRATPAG